jgi:SH3-like domain-containing protein
MIPLNFKFLSRLFTCVIIFFIFTGGFINVYEKKEEVEGSIEAVVSSVQENYIALVYNSKVKGVDEELGFARRPDVELVYKYHWGQIKRGEPVVARFKEIRRVREGRADTGELKREVIVLERRLLQLEFTKPKKRELISGV